MPSKKTNNYPQYTYPIIFVLVLLLLGMIFVKSNKIGDFPKVSSAKEEDVAHLYSGNGHKYYAVATKRLSSDGSVIDITAYLNTGAQYPYGVWIKNDSGEAHFIGQLTYMANIYSLSFESSKDYGSYNDIVIAILQDDQAGDVILKGSFPD
jgi:hypothetical protein